MVSLTPACANVIAGQSEVAGQLLLVHSDGRVLAETTVREPNGRTHAAGCRFEFHVPLTLRDGQSHALRVLDGERCERARTEFRSVKASGSIDSVDGGLIRGTVETDETDPPAIQLVAVVDDEVVATALAHRPQGSDAERRFALFVPAHVRSNGQRIVHVYIVGGAGPLRGSPAVLDSLPRAQALFRRQAPPSTIAIKIAAPNVRVAHEWGDYHFATQLARSLSQRGWVARVDCHDEWSRTGDDVVLVLRGRRRHIVDRKAINILWQISHPDRAVPEEFADYDHIFVASDIYAKELGRYTATPVSVLHQATDPSVFFPPFPKLPIGSSALFVGNSRREYRTLVKWCVEADIDCLVFGTHWRDLIPERFLRGEHIANDDVHLWYGSCAVLLNDHWESMRVSGFLSNRLFDGSAAGAFIISDDVKGLAQVFGDAIETVASPEELKAKIAHYRQNPAAASAKAKQAREIVLRHHTFEHRADTILETVEQIRRRPQPSAIHV